MMWSFIKKLFSERDKEVTVVVLDEDNPNGTSSFKLRSPEVIKLALVVILISVLLTSSIFLVTPLGSIYQSHKDDQLREQALLISERIGALQDSLLARDAQLDELKYFIRTARDTTFEISGQSFTERPERRFTGGANNTGFSSSQPLTQNEIIFSGRLDNVPDFPADMPVEGRFTQGYSAQAGHYGIDIAAVANAGFRSLADGTVVNTNWTISHGHVIFVQHTSGIMSVYKHASKLHKKQGDFVLKGDLLGEVGDKGVLSSGSHLHLEIWKNGIPQDPLTYLHN